MIIVVTAPDVVLEFRPPRVVLVLYGASLVVAAGMAVLFVRELAGGDLFTFVFPVFLLGILAFNGATALSRARARGDGSLEVRNRFSTQRLQRAEVDQVMVGRRAGFGSARRLELLLSDGSVLPLVGTETPPFPGSGQRLEDQAGRLRDWVAGTPSPFV